MGLVQNHIEGAGVSTVSMSVQPHITATVGAPRGVFLRYPQGNQVGEAGKPRQQRTILSGVLEAAMSMKAPGTIVEFPYRWRRFPVHEEPVYSRDSDGVRHPQTEAIAEALDSLVVLTRDYKAYMEERVAREAAGTSRIPGVERALSDHVARIEQLVAILDGDALDQLREIVNRVTTLELRVDGKFV